MKIITKIGTLTVLFLFAVGALWAGDVTGGAITTITTLFTYVPDTAAKASEVNQNFALMRDAVNDNYTRVTDNDTDIASLVSGAATLNTRITSLESGAFILNQNETVTGRPYFYGGTSGSTPPFYVDSTLRITSLNADYLDGYHYSSFAFANHAGQSKKAGSQNLNWTSTYVSSTSQVLVASVYVGDTYSKDVSFNAHVVLEASTSTTGRYELVIRRGGSTGTILGKGWWRPPPVSGLHAVTLSFTGFDNNISGAYWYYFYARKYDSGAPNALIGPYGFTAGWVRN